MKRKTILKQPTAISFRSLCKESDRGCVIIIASILNEFLGHLHDAYIAKSIYPSRENIFKTLCKAYAPLSTFAGRTQLAYAYGLIDVGDCKDLDLIRKLRNEAAHNLYDFSLRDTGAESTIRQLTAVERYRKLWDAQKAGLLLSRSNVPMPKLKETQRLLIVNFFALHGILSLRTANAVEAFMNRRKSN